MGEITIRQPQGAKRDRIGRFVKKSLRNPDFRVENEYGFVPACLTLESQSGDLKIPIFENSFA
jgi:hypothetical protein